MMEFGGESRIMAPKGLNWGQLGNNKGELRIYLKP